MALSSIKAFMFVFCSSLILNFSLSQRKNPYCYLKYEGKPNLLCDLEPCAITSKRCMGDAEELPFSQEERFEILQLHNQVRQEFNEQGGGWTEFEYALNMKMLKYDLELEFAAQCWANMCIYYGEEEYCRRTKRFSGVGYNKYLKVVDYNYNASDPRFVEEAIVTWKNKTKFGMPVEYRKEAFNETSWDFRYGMQLIWANNTHVGCGKIKFGTIKSFLYLVCFYAVAIKVGERPYKITGSNRDIFNLTNRVNCIPLKNKNFKYMCENNMVDTDLTWTKPFELNPITDEDYVDVPSEYYLDESQTEFAAPDNETTTKALAMRSTTVDVIVVVLYFRNLLYLFSIFYP